jgi:hypothetical protein
MAERCATRARSMHSCTEEEASKAKPVWRAGHDVLVVTEDGQSVGGQARARHMENAGQKFAGDLYMLGIMSKQTLRTV